MLVTNFDVFKCINWIRSFVISILIWRMRSAAVVMVSVVVVLADTKLAT